MNENNVSSITAPYEVAGPEDPKAGEGGGKERADASVAADAPVAGSKGEQESGGKEEPGESEQQVKEGDSESPEVLARISKATKEEATEALKENGLDFTKFEREYMASGDLSEESYKELEKAGITKKHVEAYLRGNEALMHQTVTDITGMAGGMESYQAMTEWAAKNMPKEDVDAYNEAMNSGNIPLIKMAVSGLVARYQASEGAEPTLLGGRAPAARSGGVAGYASKEEMVAAMRDPRYGKDSAYTREVERKTGASTFFGY